MLHRLATRDRWLWRGVAIVALASGATYAAWPRHHRGCHRGESARTAPKIMPPAPTQSGIVAVIETSEGTIECTLDSAHAPNTVQNFILLARGEITMANDETGRHFYDGLSFHRVVPGFVIQGGDPSGTGRGGPGYMIPDEVSLDLHFDHPGVLAMASSGPNTGGSQFFITDGAAPIIEHTSTIFGQCNSPEVVHKIASVPRDTGDRPLEPVTIRHVTIVTR